MPLLYWALEDIQQTLIRLDGWDPPLDWLWFEPWGETLGENNVWTKNGFLFGSDTYLGNSLSSIFSDGQSGINISTPIPANVCPLKSATGQNLYVHHCAPYSDYHPTEGWLSYIFVTTNGVDLFDIEPVITRGTRWGSWPKEGPAWDDVYTFDLGQGPGIFNLTEWWIKGRTAAGRSTDPVGWYVSQILITNEQFSTAVAQTSTTDYLALAHTQHGGGFTIVTKSDVACHMWLRHTLREPQKHAKPVERRGLIIAWDARFCFVAFEDLEQNEAGDTFTHTFTWPGWTNCMTRYFYFWATNAGEAMKSTSCLFSKHYLYVPPALSPFYNYYYTDPHPEVVCVDGHASHLHAGSTWDHILHGPGSSASDHLSPALLQMAVSNPENTFLANSRSIFLFDTRALSALKEIGSAQIEFWGLSKGQTPGWGLDNLFKVNIVLSWPLSNTALQVADYLRTGSTLMSNSVTWADWPIGRHQVLFPLNAWGISQIIPGGISKFALKEVNFDIGSVAPPWLADHAINIQVQTAETGWEGQRPRLKVVYKP